VRNLIFELHPCLRGNDAGTRFVRRLGYDLDLPKLATIALQGIGNGLILLDLVWGTSGVPIPITPLDGCADFTRESTARLDQGRPNRSTRLAGMWPALHLAKEILASRNWSGLLCFATSRGQARQLDPLLCDLYGQPSGERQWHVLSHGDVRDPNSEAFREAITAYLRRFGALRTRVWPSSCSNWFARSGPNGGMPHSVSTAESNKNEPADPINQQLTQYLSNITGDSRAAESWIKNSFRTVYTTTQQLVGACASCDPITAPVDGKPLTIGGLALLFAAFHYYRWHQPLDVEWHWDVDSSRNVFQFAPGATGRSANAAEVISALIGDEASGREGLFHRISVHKDQGTCIAKTACLNDGAFGISLDVDMSTVATNLGATSGDGDTTEAVRKVMKKIQAITSGANPIEVSSNQIVFQSLP